MPVGKDERLIGVGFKGSIEMRFDETGTINQITPCLTDAPESKERFDGE